jgi:hypothetical protein
VLLGHKARQAPRAQLVVPVPKERPVLKGLPEGPALKVTKASRARLVPKGLRVPRVPVSPGLRARLVPKVWLVHLEPRGRPGRRVLRGLQEEPGLKERLVPRA